MIDLAPYYKTVQAALGQFVTVGTAVTTLLTLVPAHDRGIAIGVSIFMAIIAVAKTVDVYMTKNAPLVDRADQVFARAIPMATEVGSAVGKAVEKITESDATPKA